MVMSVKQRSMAAAVMVVLILGQGVYAAEKKAADANAQPAVKSDSDTGDIKDENESGWEKWDAVVKDTNDANELLKAKVDAVLAVVRSKEMDQKHKEKIIDKIISPFFDFDLMSKLVLGKAHWMKFTNSEQKSFTEKFTKRLKDSYLDKITLYKDEKIMLKPAERQKGSTYIPMEVVSNDKKIVTVYKLRRLDKRWQVYDVEIEGVSILLTYRAQFDDILSHGSAKDVLSQLEKSVTR